MNQIHSKKKQRPNFDSIFYYLTKMNKFEDVSSPLMLKTSYDNTNSLTSYLKWLEPIFFIKKTWKLERQILTDTESGSVKKELAKSLFQQKDHLKKKPYWVLDRKSYRHFGKWKKNWKNNFELKLFNSL